MKKLIMILALVGFMNSAMTSVFAAETVGEKVDAKTNNVKRKVKKTAHKIDETICDQTDKSCLAKKAKHRAEETKDYTKDKVSEGKNIIDNDSK